MHVKCAGIYPFVNVILKVLSKMCKAAYFIVLRLRRCDTGWRGENWRPFWNI